MKNFKKIIAIFLIAMALMVSSCKKQLELAPYNQLSDATAFATPERCMLALNGVYDAAQSGDYDPLNGTAHTVRGYPFGAAAIAQGEMRGEDMVNIATFYQITYLATYSPVSPNNVNMWINLYLLINKANLSIDGFRSAQAKGVISAAVEAQYEAECRFLRAMAHHELVINFARPYADGNGNKPGVPYHDYALSSSAALERLRAQKRDSVSVVYAKMFADLDYAEANLGITVPATVNGQAVPVGANTFRATKAAAIALKMRLRLHMGDWNGVITEGNKLIPATTVLTPLTPSGLASAIGPWRLEALPTGPFTNNQSLESMFSIKNDALDNTGVNASMPQMMGPNGSGRGLVAISSIAYNLAAWKCDDKRRTSLTFTGLSNTGTTSYFTKKYTDYVNQSDYAPYIRWAEVLLMMAEANARTNATVNQRAIDFLNYVRNRSLVSPVTDQYTIASFVDKNALIKAILDERRIEFLAEGKRWGDIHRLALDPVFSPGGIPAKNANGFSNLANYACPSPGVTAPITTVLAIPYADYRFLWPIPQDERAQNPIVDQNPGY
ncbi:MAG: RagB/SusD family nutrient uptake outer membrane protein [Ferruginibacter sp.]